MNKLTKSFSLITIALMIMLLFLSCGGKDGAETAAPDVQETESTETTADDSPVFPADADFGGYEYRILVTVNTENNWQKNDFRADEMTGDVLNDARFERNRAVEERFNVKIISDEQYGAAKGAGTGFMLISKSVMAGDGVYSAAMINGYEVCNLACSGYLCDLNDLPYVDLTKEWWDQKANRDLTIQTHMYYTTGDISSTGFDATCCNLFNKKLVVDFSLESPYDLVRDGKWTFDAMMAMGVNVSSDLDGDGKMTSADRFGSIVWDDSIMAAVNGALIKCGTVNNDGRIELTLNTPITDSVIGKYCDYVFSDDCYRYQRVSYDITEPVNMFASDRALFFMQMLDLTSYFRNMETDFGILPVPKYDESQLSYGHTIGSWHSQFLSVPNTLPDPERTGMVLESLAYESMKRVTPAYYDKTLIGKYFRDDESVEMLDIILKTRVFDLGWYYQLGLYNDEILYMVYAEKNNWASRYEKYESKALADTERINSAFEEFLGRQ
jgi:hypothetical protein